MEREQKWILFLESGSVCLANETCNRRYFQPHIRARYNQGAQFNALSYGDFDTVLAWAETGGAGLPLTEVVEPYMTSVYCFGNETQFFSDSNNLAVEGKDILDSDCSENPTFCDHGHVLVPYCSSDMWLASDNLKRNTSQFSSLLKEEPCDCWDQSCFRYNPTSEDLQFTFRGQTIIQSVLQTLDRMYNLQIASEIVLVGSSAGGVGVLNTAQWVRDNYPNVSLKLIDDSSWFINFQESLTQSFRLAVARQNIVGLSVIEACFDQRLGYPCCVSPQCLLMERNTIGEPYIPNNIPLFVLTSLYDIFILSLPLSGLSAERPVGLGIDFITLLGEYGGAMNETLLQTAALLRYSGIQLSYFASQCFQHVYFAGSTLRGEDRLYGAGGTDVNLKVAEFQ